MRRANGEGTIRERTDGRWEVRYYVPKGSGRERRTIYAKTKAAAREGLKKALDDRDRGVVPAPARETVATYLATWLDGVEPTLRPRTADNYRQITTTYLMPPLSKVPLIKLQPPVVQQLYRDLGRQGLSAKTIVNVHCILHRALEQAYRWRLIGTNVADLVDPPRVARREMRALTPEQARLVLAAAASDQLEALWHLAITAGLRQGELLALRWPQVDLDRGTVSVVGTLEQRAGHEHVIAEPKTQRSRRQVQLGAATVESLRRQRAASSSIGFVFSRVDGRPLSTSIVVKAWDKLQARAGVSPRVRFHDLRHTAATLMLSRGVHPKIVSEMLGHATVAITLDLYSHVTPTMQREAAQVMDDLLSPPAG